MAQGSRAFGLSVRGRRAGIVSRGISVGVDWVVVQVMFVLGLAAWGLFDYLLAGNDFHVPRPPLGATGGLQFALLVTYLTISWSGSGRTVGQLTLGLRTLTDPAGPLRVRTAFARALLCAFFGPILLLWIIPSRRNAAVQDVVCNTVVVYDWH
ncbi:MAG: domain containing protein [Actinomycetia bacterium]|nr:domain containing protein [Actinomycetes bacterium]